MSPKISVIVPVYNVEKYLEKCVNSILNQTFKDFELILIDDCSPDNSGRMCDEFNDERIKVIHLKKNEGISNVRNTGLQATKGEYIFFVDSDDFIGADTLKEVVEIIDENNSDIVIFGYKKILEIDGAIKSEQDVSYKDCNLKSKKEIADVVLDLKKLTLIDAACNKFYKASVIKNNNLKYPYGEIYEDTEFNLQILSYINSMTVINKCYYNYMQRESSGSITKSYNPKKIVYLKKRCETLNNYLKSQNLFNGENEKICNYFYLKYIFSCFIDLSFPNCSLSKKEKIAFINSEINDDSYLNVINNVSADGKIDKIIIKIAKTKNKNIIYFFSKLMYIVKFKMQKLFAKIS